MRKLLLASSALLGTSIGIATVGHAGTLTPNAPNPAPGSVTVTLNALVEAFVFDATDSGLHNATQTNGAGSTYNTKYQTYGVGSYARIYPSIDGVLANGIKYGASLEIRQNSTQLVSGSGAADTFFAYREFVYVATDQFGKIEAGTPVQPTELFQTGNPANFNTGGWDGDLPGAFATGLPYFIDDTNDRSEKVVYVSPQFAGFDFGVSFEPSDNAVADFPNTARDSSVTSTLLTTTTVTDAATGLPLTTTTSATNPLFGKRRNTLDGAARYQGAFGAVGVKAEVGGSVGGSVRAVDGGPQPKNFNLIAAGLAVTFGGLQLMGHLDTGAFGPGLQSTSSGHTTAYVAGASYTMGPMIVGASYYGFDSGYTRSASLTGGALHGYGIAAGGTYTLAPGASIFLEYLYGHQRADGYDIVNATGGFNNNNTRAQAFGIGTALKW